MEIELEKKICEEYLARPISCIKLAEKHKLTQCAVWRAIKRNNIKPKKRWEIYKKHTVNDFYFDKIDTEDKAYFLGLLCADGCVDKKYISFAIALQSEDMYILQKFCEIIKSTRPIGVYKVKNGERKDSAYMKVFSERLAKNLKKLGCINKKSLKLKFPTSKQVPIKLLRHFIRGYFDGDGHISIKKKLIRGYICPKGQFSIVSTFDFCQALSDFIDRKIGIRFTVRKDGRNNSITSTIYSGGMKNIVILMDWLYKGATIYLKRKHNSFIEMKNYINSRGK